MKEKLKRGLIGSIATAAVIGGSLVSAGSFAANDFRYSEKMGLIQTGGVYAAEGPGKGAKNPTELKDSDLKNPKNYMYWLQYWGPWAEGFGGKGTGGAHWQTSGENNAGCVATSYAIALAKAGVTKANGHTLTPADGSMDQHGPGAATTVRTDKGTAVRDLGTGFSGGQMSAKEALDKAKQIGKAGDYPLLRVNGNVHTVAYWKPNQKGNAPAVYDPARGYYGDNVKTYNHVGAVKVPQGKKFSEDDPGPDMGSVNSGKSDDKDDKKDGKGDADQAKIKPTFNPFFTPKVGYSDSMNQKGGPGDDYMGAGANIDNDNTNTRAQVLAMSDDITSKVIPAFRVFALFLIYVLIAWGFITMLLEIADVEVAGMFSTAIGAMGKGNTASKLLLPDLNDPKFNNNGGHPVLAIIKTGGIRFIVTMIIAITVQTGGFSMIVSQIISWIANFMQNP